MRAHSHVVLSLLTLLFTFTTSSDALGMGRRPILPPPPPPPPSVLIVSQPGNYLVVLYQNLPFDPGGRWGAPYEILLLGKDAREGALYHTEGARFYGGTGIAVVRLGPSTPPDSYKVRINNIYSGDKLATSRDFFYYTPRLDSLDSERLVSDNGMGNGRYDKMTYADFSSVQQLTALDDILIGRIVPSVWYCNGACWFEVTIRDPHDGRVIVTAKVGTWPVGGTMGHGIPIRIKLKRNARVIVETRLWSTKSVGLHTTGRQNGTKKSGVFRHDLLRSSYPDRGGIGLQLWEVR